MLGYYTSKRRKSSSLASPPSIILQSPAYGDAIHDSPASTSFASPRLQQTTPPSSSRDHSQSPNAPITPVGGDIGLRHTSADGPSRLVAAKDFAKPPRSDPVAQEGSSAKEPPSIPKDKDQSTLNSHAASEEPFTLLSDHNTSRSTLPAHAPPPRASRPIDVKSIPPASVHDAYVSGFIKPSVALDMGAGGEHHRPSIHRSSSAPGEANHGLLPSALPQSPEKKKASKAGIPQPVFEIFNAEISEDGDNLCRNMRGYLDKVFKGQEEVARMHLALEALGENDDQVGKENKEGGDGAKVEMSLKAREKGVDEIMQKLDALSDSLRTYHDLGTPRLSFQHPHPQGFRPRTNTVDIGTLSQHPTFDLPHDAPAEEEKPPQTTTSQRPSPPTIVRSHSDVELSPLSKDPARTKSPLRNAFIPSSAVVSDEEDEVSSEAPKLARKGLSANLPPLRLSREPSLDDVGIGKGKEKPKTFWEREQEMDRQKANKQTWLEDVGGGMTDSPVEMGTRGQKPF
ncbi:hypothetical protein I350_07448 [Cryptococcus amylolentus CBS 6273]|uniref:Uncharacterized protein n=1 Tax=Cryptococcus amylolentus CBS 6273 TaxID=1296118 RepID=A0A1E3JF29_9TREE|nr:hypothetical protein I350_07448 [Cryptococcus amylolentus CBS 6273]